MIWAKECSKENREAPHDLCTIEFFLFGYKCTKQDHHSPKINRNTKQFQAGIDKKRSLAFATNIWLSSMYMRQPKNRHNQNDVCETRQST